MVSNEIFKLLEAVLRGEAPFITRRMHSIIISNGYQLPGTLVKEVCFLVFLASECSLGTFFLILQIH